MADDNQVRIVAWLRQRGSDFYADCIERGEHLVDTDCIATTAIAALGNTIHRCHRGEGHKGDHQYERWVWTNTEDGARPKLPARSELESTLESIIKTEVMAALEAAGVRDAVVSIVPKMTPGKLGCSLVRISRSGWPDHDMWVSGLEDRAEPIRAMTDALVSAWGWSRP